MEFGQTKRGSLAVLAVTALVAALTVPGAVGLGGVAKADTLKDGQVSQGGTVNPDPVGWTPHVIDGSVRAITQVGSNIVAGGNFSKVSQTDGSPELDRPGLVIFQNGSGNISSAAPQVVGRVETVHPGVAADTVWISGTLSSVNGVSGRLFLLDTNTGGVLQAVKVSGPVYDSVLKDGELIIAGAFNWAGGKQRGGVASVDASGQVTDSVIHQFDGHHNWDGSGAKAGVGPKAIDISADESRLAVIGNFTTVDGEARDQVAVLDLAGGSSALSSWYTSDFEASCSSRSFDTYMRAVHFSPDGESFNIATTGGPYNGTLCDTATKWNGLSHESDEKPDWEASTGGDTLFSIASTGDAVYVGGHQRWLNNVDGRDRASDGAMARPGVASLEATSGVPNAWNPGRHPRGVGAFALHATEEGLWMGSDTDWLGYYEVKRPKIAFFPRSGGEDSAAADHGDLPGTLNTLTVADELQVRTTEDGSAFADSGAAAIDLQEATVRGATLVDGNLYYGSTDGYLHKRTFDALTGSLGDDEQLNPYQSELWDDRRTGSGDSIYAGRTPEIYDEWNQIEGLAYRAGYMYFTRSGDNNLYRSGFSLSSGAFEPFKGSGQGHVVATDLDNPGALTFAGDDLFYVNESDGSLNRATLTDRPLELADADVISGPGLDGIDWRSRALFLTETPHNDLPTAAFTPAVLNLDVSFDGSASSDSEGEIASYSWNLGDGSTATGPTVNHSYAAPGTYPVQLTVTDEQGQVGSVTQDVIVSEAPSGEYVGTQGYDGNSKVVEVDLPSGTQAGDKLVLFRSVNSPSATLEGPTGVGDDWMLLGADQNRMDSAAYTVTVDDPNAKIALESNKWVKWNVSVVGYRGIDLSAAQFAASTANRGDTASTPEVVSASEEFLELSYWSAKSSTVGSFGTPTYGDERYSTGSSGSGRISAALADRLVAAPVGFTAGGNAVTADTAASRWVLMTVLVPTS